jgi:uncharacterized protein YjbI with pentapeptide repeats/energy-coupling factor transporter ATP-binding protein EcfA2
MTTLSVKPIEPARAAVVPRGSVAGGETLPLESHIRALYRRHPLIAIVGPTGSGKTTALAHLAAALSDLEFDFSDEPEDLFTIFSNGLPIVAAFDELPIAVTFDVVLDLAPWGESERIDYLLAKHSAQVRSVMERLNRYDTAGEFEGSPRLWSAVLDLMAEQSSVVDVRGALRHIMNAILAMFGEDEGCTRDIMCSAARSNIRDPRGVPAFLKHPLMLRIALVEALLETIDETPASHWWQSLHDAFFVPGDSVFDLLTSRLRDEHVAIMQLRRRIEKSDPETTADRVAQAPMAAALLAVDRAYRPTPNVINLDRIQATDVDWSGSSMVQVSFVDANFARTNLHAVNWSNIIATRINLRQANLTFANLSDARLSRAVLDEASLPGANLSNADLTYASAMMTNFNGARLARAELRRTDLRGASFIGATLHHAILIDLLLAAADFTGATLTGAMCLSCDFRESIWTNAILNDGMFNGSTLADMAIDGISATNARFSKADLTGLRLRGANLRGAIFRQAGLAEIDWEGADLRDCDFTHAAFHMGTSRSGLVFSPIACEGSRTGFYTHDDLERYKLPEEIRVANLCGANLIGAEVTRTDWYLVDLRGARYTTDQAEWFRKCGAILVDRR